jgi:DNA polymerase III subunit gamma/tau
MKIKTKDTRPLHLRYRPQSLDDVIGQEAVVRSLSQQLSGDAVPHAYLFTGPSGVGKTSLARIIANMTGCDNANIMEIDAATNSGVDNMRMVTQMAQYRGIGDSPNKFIIIDEVHALSKATFQSLLLSIEEPPPHVYWALCTTEADKIPATIKTRCAHYDLKPVEWEVIAEHLTTITQQEGLDVAESLCSVIARRAEGSVRQALQWLSMVNGVKDKSEINEILENAEENVEAIDIAKSLVSGRGITWKGTVQKVQALEKVSPESVRIVVVNYVGAALLRTESEKDAVRLLNILQAFSSPFNASEKQAPLLLALGSVIFNT